MAVKLSSLDERVNRTMSRFMEGTMNKLVGDITGEGTILSSSTTDSANSSSTQSAPSTSVGHTHPPSADELNRRAAKTQQPSQLHRPNRKQQLKHAMTVQSAHMITTDYVALSQPLTNGMLLNDRTAHKLTLIHSLGELQPMHTYTTEYGNELVRMSKHKAVLAGSIEIEVTSDEAEFDNVMGALALSGTSTPSLPNTSMRMASYDAFTRQQHEPGGGSEGGGVAAAAAGSGGGACKPNGASSPHHHHHAHEAAAPPPPAYGSAGCEGAEPRTSARLDEAEALQRIEALVSRLGEMEEWFAGVKAEAERERRMREQSAARLSIMQERVELLSGQVKGLVSENRQLRHRVAVLSATCDDDDDDDHSQLGGSSSNGGAGLSGVPRPPMQGFGNQPAMAATQSTRALSSLRGGLGALAPSGIS